MPECNKCANLNRHFGKHIVYKIYTKYQTTAFLIKKGKKKVRKSTKRKKEARKLFSGFVIVVVKNTILLPIYCFFILINNTYLVFVLQRKKI